MRISGHWSITGYARMSLSVIACYEHSLDFLLHSNHAMNFPAFIACGAFASLFVFSQPLRSVTDEPIFRVGHGVTAPHPLNQPAPEYSEEARRAGLQGECVLSVIVNSDGKSQDMSVSRRLDMGLDEKSVEAVQNWTFEPARKDGKPVAVRSNVVTTFRLGNSATTPEGLIAQNVAPAPRSKSNEPASARAQYRKQGTEALVREQARSKPLR
jgi:TonB family protein